MSQPTEQLNELHKKNIDAAMKLTQLSMENSKRIIELQVETARTLFEESVKNAQALAEAKDPQAALALRTQFAQDTAQKMMESMRHMGEIATTAQAEFTRTLTQQVSGAGHELMESFQKMMALSNIPGGNQSAVVAMQHAFDNAKSAFDEIAKTSTAAFSNMAHVTGKAKKD